MSDLFGKSDPTNILVEGSFSLSEAKKRMKRKRVAILGSTGSIGKQTLDVISAFKDTFEVVGLAAGSNINLLA